MYDSTALVIGLKLVVALLCGGAIGIERELRRKPAGLRTNMLICMGATLFMITSRHIGSGAAYTDPARLVAQVVTGVGFIGAGVIIQARGSVTGLTTAATIFVVTAVGIAIGDGMFGPALLGTTLIIFVLVMVRPLERSIVRYRRLYRYTFETADPALSLSKLFNLLEEENISLDSFNVKDLGGAAHQIRFSVVTSIKGNKRLLERLPVLGTELSASMHDQSD